MPDAMDGASRSTTPRCRAHCKVVHDPSGPGADTVITGLLNLNMMVLFMLVKEQGATAENMPERAAAVLRELSRQLPE